MKVAIYSRKSKITDSGESIANQIELCKEYLSHHFQQYTITVYEDEGFSGGNTNRPEFQKLMYEIKERKFNVLMCYRLDRISRNVADFASTLDILQKYEVSFISIKEQFDTSTPMGRAMVYIASVFAQLERETIAERIKDNMLELAKDGRWLGGQTPLGFTSEPLLYYDSDFKEKKMFKLSPIPSELEQVKLIYNKYLHTGSISKTLKYLLSNNFKGKNGGDLASRSIIDILRNPTYARSTEEIYNYLAKKGINLCGIPNGNGLLIYNKKDSKYKDKILTEWVGAVGKHEGIISSDKWLEVQNRLDKNTKKDNPRMGTSKKSLLSGILKCSQCGSPMRVSYGHKKKRNEDRIYYYICTLKANSGNSRCSNKNIRGDYLEKIVMDNLIGFNKTILINELEALKAENTLSLISSNTKNLKNHIAEKENRLNNLTKQLSKADNELASNSIMSDINQLGKELMNLKTNLLNSQSKNIDTDINLAINSLDDFNSVFQIIESIKDHEATIDIKRFLLHKIIDKISYDGQSNDIRIDFWGSK